MAVNFQHHIEILIRDFQRRGLKPEIVQTFGNPPRAMEIRVANKISVHWDADSRSVWAEGPWPEIDRLENYIHRRFNGRWRRRLRSSKKWIRVAAVGLIATVLLGVGIPFFRTHPEVLKWPFHSGAAPKEPGRSTNLEGTGAKEKPTEGKSMETVANAP